MSDFDTLKAMYDRAGITYDVIDKGNFYLDEDRFSIAIETAANYRYAGEYAGFVTDHTFDKDGNLLNVYIWE